MLTHITTTRRGMTVIEVTIALSLLAMGLVLMAQVFTACARQHLAAEQTLIAQQEADNVLEHFAGLRYEEVTADAARAIVPSPQLHAALPDAKLQIAITDSTATDSAQTAGTADLAPPHKHIHVEVTWPSEADLPHTVSLSAWKFTTTQAPASAAQVSP
jgi:Tfp pilus assembly protein PilV